MRGNKKMKKIEFKNLENIVLSFHEDEQKLNEVTKEFKKNAIKYFLPIMVSNQSYKKFKLYKSGIVKDVKRLKKSIGQKETYLKDLCEYDFTTLKYFLEETLSSSSEEYRAIDIVLEKEKKWSTLTEEVCLIAPSLTCDVITYLVENGFIEDSDQMEVYLDHENYLLLDREETYPLFDYDKGEVNEELTFVFPELSEAVMALLHYRMAHPNIEKEQAVAIATEQFLFKKKNEVSPSKKVVGAPQKVISIMDRIR